MGEPIAHADMFSTPVGMHSPLHGQSFSGLWVPETNV